ncbi:Poly(rC)-binding protein 3 [Symbiodinium microadriaticum]|uniref:Poly(RC)-binding protein 3 n=1 Tax=Symbiodinium microadriaticum TaxID=2951 RepID=A0A1Q9DTL1_SYMMI|nr:Poly(rC)-binding protein 3 [Symbiodinium microadriaticum]
MNASDLPCRILLSDRQVRQVLGDRGEESLKRLRMGSGANIQLLRGPLLPAAFRARDEFLAVFWADDGARLRRALSGVLEKAFATRQVAGAAPPAEPAATRVLEVMIPEVACRHLIGARGDRIKLLREESACEIHLSPGNVAGIAAQRRVKCNGSVASLVEAAARVHEVLVEFAEIGILSLRHFDLQEVTVGEQEDPAVNGSRRPLGAGLAGIARREARNARVAVRQLVVAEECGWLIGKRGNKIQKLRELALVATRDGDEELCQDRPRSVVEIFGATMSKCLCVLQLIVDDLELFPEVVPITSLLLPKNLAPFAPIGFDEAARRAGCDASLRETPRERGNPPSW